MLKKTLNTANVWQYIGDLRVGDQVSVDWGRRISGPKDCYRGGGVIKQITPRIIVMQGDTCCFSVSLPDLAAGAQIKPVKKKRGGLVS